MSDKTAIDDIDRLIAAHAAVEGPMLPILHAIQAAFGHIPETAIARIAEALNLSRAEVHGVVSFYHDFREKPAGRQVIRLCRSEACQAQGGAALQVAAERLTGLATGETSADGAVTLEAVYCLGLCACGPAADVNGVLHGRVDAQRLTAILGEAS